MMSSKKKGWRNEPIRHSLASKGVETSKSLFESCGKDNENKITRGEFKEKISGWSSWSPRSRIKKLMDLGLPYEEAERWSNTSKRELISGHLTILDDINEYREKKVKGIQTEKKQVKDRIAELMRAPEVQSSKNEKEIILDTISADYSHRGYDEEEFKNLIAEVEEELGTELRGEYI